MRLAESNIRAAILHPEEEVRLTALRYFYRAPGDDEALMPLVIEAVEKYGREKSFSLLRSADKLAQTPETIRWLVEELSKDWDMSRVDDDNYRCAVALVLCNARTDLLRPDMTELRSFPEELVDRLVERLDMSSWDWDTGWDALEMLGEEARERGHFCISDARRSRRILESLARHREQGLLILPLLERRYRGKERDLMEWLESSLAELAGRMRLQEAVPILVERLHEDDLDLSNSCTTALEEIGGDHVVRTIAEHWDSGSSDFRCSAAEVMEYIHTDLSTETCARLLAGEEEEDAKIFLANALLGHFVDETIEPIRQMLLGQGKILSPDLADLKERLTAVSTVMGVSFPEYEAWYKEAVVNAWGWRGLRTERIRHSFEEAEDDEDLDEDWEDEDLDEEEEQDDYGDLDEDDFEEEPYGPRPIRNLIPPPRRNAPCPCGSGKKYKQCCMKRDEGQSRGGSA